MDPPKRGAASRSPEIPGSSGAGSAAGAHLAASDWRGVVGQVSDRRWHRGDRRERPGQQLLVYGDIDAMRRVVDAFDDGSARKTREHVTPWLKNLGRDRRFHVTGDGSIPTNALGELLSPRGISLNIRLMFLPQHLVRYTLLHELAHTRGDESQSSLLDISDRSNPTTVLWIPSSAVGGVSSPSGSGRSLDGIESAAIASSAIGVSFRDTQERSSTPEVESGTQPLAGGPPPRRRARWCARTCRRRGQLEGLAV